MRDAIPVGPEKAKEAAAAANMTEIEAKKIAAKFASEFAGRAGNASVRVAILTERLTPIIQQTIHAVARECAEMVDTRCGTDTDPMGMTCAGRGDYPVRHEPRCNRPEYDSIMEWFSVPTP